VEPFDFKNYNRHPQAMPHINDEQQNEEEGEKEQEKEQGVSTYLSLALGYC
jgi:hypothetical protein